MGQGYGQLKWYGWQFSRLAVRLLGAVLCLIVLGALTHESGHGLAAIVCGGRVTQLNVLGVQFPPLAWNWTKGYWGWTRLAGEFTAIQTAWINLSGNLATMLISIVALPLYLHHRSGTALHILLLGLSLFFLDTLAHTLPTFGLPMYLFFGSRSVDRVSEGYRAAIALGVPGWIFQTVIVSYALLAMVLIGRKLWSERLPKQIGKR